VLGRNPFLIEQALRLGEAARAAVFRAAERSGFWPLPDSLHHSDNPSHGHAYYLPEDADEDGAIDHVVMFVERGLPDGLVPALAETHDIALRGIGRWQLAPDWMGRRGAGGLFGPARRWVAATPFVTMRWRSRKRGGEQREKDSVERQLLGEIARLAVPSKLPRLPAPVAFGIADTIMRGETPPRSVAAFETRFSNDRLNARRPADAAAVAAEVLFPDPVWGPLALGFGCHFGLGLFEPADQVEPIK
jgi:CRISPR-associated protein Csb2